MLTSDANNCMNYESCKLKSIIVQAMKLQHEKKIQVQIVESYLTSMLPTSIIKF